jgi:hypothetical protein
VDNPVRARSLSHNVGPGLRPRADHRGFAIAAPGSGRKPPRRDIEAAINGEKGIDHVRCRIALALGGLLLDPVAVGPASARVEQLDTANLVACAQDGGVCRMPYPTNVYYGVPGKTNGRPFPQGGMVPCNSQTFGDPAPGQPKSCWYAPRLSETRGGGLRDRGDDYEDRRRDDYRRRDDDRYGRDYDRPRPRRPYNEDYDAPQRSYRNDPDEY